MDFAISNLHKVAVIFFVVTIVLAHFLADSNYKVQTNTISDLGAQGYSKGFVMQSGLFLFGVMLAVSVLINGVTILNAPILLYALCIAVTGVFSTKPFFGNDSYSVTQANLHSAFAQAAGILFCTAIAIQIYFEISLKVRLMHFVFLLLVLGMSVLFGVSKNYGGIFQRILYTVSFYWLCVYFRMK